VRAVIPHADPNLVYDIKYYSESSSAVHTRSQWLVPYVAPQYQRCLHVPLQLLRPISLCKSPL
jgi:hypothetical protein